MDKRHPTNNDMLAWHLFRLMDVIPPDELDPELLKGLIDLFHYTPKEDMHRELYEEYEAYRELFIR